MASKELKAIKKANPKGMSEKQDAKYDKKLGIKEDSKADKKMDKYLGVKQTKKK